MCEQVKHHQCSFSFMHNPVVSLYLPHYSPSLAQSILQWPIQPCLRPSFSFLPRYHLSPFFLANVTSLQRHQMNQQKSYSTPTKKVRNDAITILSKLVPSFLPSVYYPCFAFLCKRLLQLGCVWFPVSASSRLGRGNFICLNVRLVVLWVS
jgi:hypothetical protein